MSVKRGSACLPCRARKVRCDGVRPGCTPCKRRGDDCQFPGEPLQSQLLELQIDSLKSRLEELESMSKVSGSRSSRDGSPTVLRSPRLRFPGVFPLVEGWWNFEEPPAALRRALLECVLSCTGTIAFFLDPPRFINSYNVSAPIGHHSRPSAALLNTVFLWGITLFPDRALNIHEPVYLGRAIHYTRQAPTGDHPKNDVHTIQAEILLSLYFFQAGHHYEAQAHSNAATSLVTHLGYHQIRSIQSPTAAAVGVNAVDEGEVINAFWACFFLGKLLTAVTGLPSSFPDPESEEGRIHTPWPLDMPQYEAGHLQLHGHDTVQTFLEDPSDSYANEDSSFFAMACKATALFERATALASQLENNLDETASEEAYSKFVSLNHRIERFYETISPILPSSGYLRSLLAVHNLTLGASIVLNFPYGQPGSSWNKKCVDAAIATVEVLAGVHFDQVIPWVHPINGNLWLKAGQVLIREILQSRSSQNDPTTVSLHEETLNKTLDRLLEIMTFFSTKSSNINHSCITLRNARASYLLSTYNPL